MDPPGPARILCPWDFPGKGTRVGCQQEVWVRSLGWEDPLEEEVSSWRKIKAGSWWLGSSHHIGSPFCCSDLEGYVRKPLICLGPSFSGRFVDGRRRGMEQRCGLLAPEPSSLLQGAWAKNLGGGWVGGEYQKAGWQGGKSLHSDGKPSKSLGLNISIPMLTPDSQILLTFCTCLE